MDNSGRDFETGLSQQQLQAAKLLADGWSIPKAAETVGCHYNTVRNWKKNIPAFRRVVANYRAPNRQPIPVTPMREMTPDALDNRLVTDAEVAPKAMAELRDALRIIK